MNSSINPLDYANDHRVSYLVAEWNRLTQAERDAQELVEVDPAMKDLAEKELTDIESQKNVVLQKALSPSGELFLGGLRLLRDFRGCGAFLELIDATCGVDGLGGPCVKGVRRA